MDDYENQRSLVEEFLDEFNPYVDTLPDPEKLNYFAGETEFIGQFMVLLGSLRALQRKIEMKRPHVAEAWTLTENLLKNWIEQARDYLPEWADELLAEILP